MEYYYSDGRNTFGPVSIEELRSKINLNTLVWRDGMANWAPASNVDEVRALFERPTPPPSSTPTPTPQPAPNPEPNPTLVSDSQKPKAKKNTGLILMAVLECIWAVFLIFNYLLSFLFSFSYQRIVYNLLEKIVGYEIYYNNILYKFIDTIVSLPFIGFWLFSLLFSIVVMIKSKKN